MNQLPLHEIHGKKTSDFITHDAWDHILPNAFTSPADEYEHWTGGYGVYDSSMDDCLVLRGKDCLALLHRLSTNTLATLSAGQSAFTVLTTEKGRIVDSIQVLHLDSELHVFCSPGRGQSVAAWIDRYTIREDVRVEFKKPWTSLTLGVHAAASLNIDVPTQGQLLVGKGSLCISHSDMGIRVSGDTDEIADLLNDALKQQNARPVGFSAINYWRIEQRIPWSPAELNESINPLEAGLTDRISFNKGCYVGQEVIARLDTYDKVQRHLVLLELESAPQLPATVTVDAREIGIITSSSKEVKSSIILCLAYIKTAHCQVGQKMVVLSTNSQQTANAVIRKS